MHQAFPGSQEPYIVEDETLDEDRGQAELIIARFTKRPVEKDKKPNCKKCGLCQEQDCKICIYCKDKKIYGGPGIKKKACKNKICQNSGPVATVTMPVGRPVAPPVPVASKRNQLFTPTPPRRSKRRGN